jgi:hypothetical protein
MMSSSAEIRALTGRQGGREAEGEGERVAFKENGYYFKGVVGIYVSIHTNRITGEEASQARQRR